MKSKKSIFTGIAVVLFWIGIWQALSLIVHNKILVAGPVETFMALMAQASDFDFWKTIGCSLLRIGGGFLSAFFLGCILAALSFKSPQIKALLSPVMTLAKSVPVASFTVILLIWWGADSLSFAISFLVALPILYVNVLEGLTHMDQRLSVMAQVFELPFFMRFLYIVRPALAPFLTGAVKTSLGMGFKAGVAAEVIGNPRWAIGTALYESKIYLNTAGVFAWTAVVVILACLMERAALKLLHCFFAWKPLLLRKPEKEKKVLQAGGVTVQDAMQCYGENKIFSHFTKVFLPGKIYCLMGASGAGKTTLLHTIAGVLPLREGRIVIEGREGFSVMFQEDRLLAGCSVLQNVTAASARHEAEEILTALGLADVLTNPVETLSGGMARRVSLARALSYNGGVLLLDEPFAGLDEESRLRAAACIRKYQNGRTVILSTHDPKDAELLQGEILKINRQASFLML